MSKRSWDGIVRVWRRQLHKFDPPKDDNEEELEELEDIDVDLNIEFDLNELEEISVLNETINVNQVLNETNK